MLPSLSHNSANPSKSWTTRFFRSQSAASLGARLGYALISMRTGSRAAVGNTSAPKSSNSDAFPFSSGNAAEIAARTAQTALEQKRSRRADPKRISKSLRILYVSTFRWLIATFVSLAARSSLP